jgi:hypothetical protein
MITLELDTLPSVSVGVLRRTRGKKIIIKKDFRQRYEGTLGENGRWSSCAF